METRRFVGGLERPEWRRLTKRELDRRTEAICQEVVKAFQDVEPERIDYLGESIEARPMDTALLVRIMSRYISLN